jgi:hypothetical protein
MFFAARFAECALQPVGLAMATLRSRQKPRFLPAATKPMSEKRPQAVFLMD